MLGKKDYQEKLYTNFQLSQRIPKDNFYRRLKEFIDLRFLYKLVEPYYGKEGQKSIDPVVFFKLMLVSYLENITYDRKLIEFVNMRLDILYFLNYDIDEELPWHSTISRTRKLFPKSMFEEVFNRVLKMCIDSGMVASHTQAIDSAYIKANASLDSLEVKQPGQSVEDYIAKTYDENNSQQPRRKAKQDKSKKEQRTIQSDKNQLRDLKTHQKWFKDKEGGPLGSQDPRARYLSNETHYSPVDPDARIAVKPGKPRQLYYLGNLSVDTSQHVITNIQANHSDKKDSRYLIDIVRNTTKRLKDNELDIEKVLADTGFSNGENYKYLEDNNIEGYIPPHGTYKGERQGFIYEPENDRWKCTQGKYVTFRKIKYQKGQLERHYLTTRSDCKECPLAKKCIGKSHEKRIRITYYREEYERAIERVTSRTGKIMKKLRQSTVEPVFGTLINYMGMSKISARGIEQANKVMLMAGTAYNLQKLMRYIQKTRKTAVIRIRESVQQEFSTYQDDPVFFRLSELDSSHLIYLFPLPHYLLLWAANPKDRLIIKY
jgi:transposase